MTTTTGPRSDATRIDVTVSGAPAIAGLRFRRPMRTTADYEALARMMSASAEADGVPWRPTATHLEEEWERSTTQDPDSDVVVAEIDDEVVGFGAVDRVVRGDVIVYGTEGHVHPDHRRRGIGGALFGEGRRRAAERADLDPAEAPIEIGAFVEHTETGHIAMLERAGFHPVRWFRLMRRDLADPIPELAIPEPLELRSLTPDQHRTVFDAENEAFRDHWGHHEPSPEQFDLTYGRDEFDGSLWVVAWDGEEVAGVVQNWVWQEENALLGVRRGWLERISVRRPWRRRGLARAITAESLRRLRDHGLDDAMLGVDADNPNGAMGLYEGLGFAVYSQAAAYRRPLERG